MLMRVATLAELPEQQGRGVQVGNSAVALFRVGTRVYAVRNHCPHAGAPLSIGRLCGTELTCAWHGWIFDVTTGESIPRNPPFDVETYRVTITDGAVFLDIPPENLTP